MSRQKGGVREKEADWDPVTTLDQSVSRTYGSFPNGELDMISIGAAGPFAPAAGGASASVASALVSTSSGLDSGLVAKGPDQVTDRPHDPDLRQASVANYFWELGRESTASHTDRGFDFETP